MHVRKTLLLIPLLIGILFLVQTTTANALQIYNSTDNTIVTSTITVSDPNLGRVITVIEKMDPTNPNQIEIWELLDNGTLMNPANISAADFQATYNGVTYQGTTFNETYPPHMYFNGSQIYLVGPVKLVDTNTGNYIWAIVVKNIYPPGISGYKYLVIADNTDITDHGFITVKYDPEVNIWYLLRILSGGNITIYDATVGSTTEDMSGYLQVNITGIQAGDQAIDMVPYATNNVYYVIGKTNIYMVYIDKNTGDWTISTKGLTDLNLSSDANLIRGFLSNSTQQLYVFYYNTSTPKELGLLNITLSPTSTFSVEEIVFKPVVDTGDRFYLNNPTITDPFAETFATLGTPSTGLLVGTLYTDRILNKEVIGFLIFDESNGTLTDREYAKKISDNDIVRGLSVYSGPPYNMFSYVNLTSTSNVNGQNVIQTYLDLCLPSPFPPLIEQSAFSTANGFEILAFIPFVSGFTFNSGWIVTINLTDNHITIFQTGLDGKATLVLHDTNYSIEPLTVGNFIYPDSNGDPNILIGGKLTGTNNGTLCNFNINTQQLTCQYYPEETLGPVIHIGNANITIGANYYREVYLVLSNGTIIYVYNSTQPNTPVPLPPPTEVLQNTGDNIGIGSWANYVTPDPKLLAKAVTSATDGIYYTSTIYSVEPDANGYAVVKQYRIHGTFGSTGLSVALGSNFSLGDVNMTGAVSDYETGIGGYGFASMYLSNNTGVILYYNENENILVPTFQASYTTYRLEMQGYLPVAVGSMLNDTTNKYTGIVQYLDRATGAPYGYLATFIDYSGIGENADIHGIYIDMGTNTILAVVDRYGSPGDVVVANAGGTPAPVPEPWITPLLLAIAIIIASYLLMKKSS